MINFSFRTLIISSILLIFSACQNSTEQPRGQKNEDTVDMLQHTVYFYLNDDATDEEKKQFEAGLRELLEIPAIHKSEMGVPSTTDERDVTDHSFAYSIFTWFKTMDDYAVYEDHPDHLEFIDKYNHLWADVKVYDTDITYERQ